VRNGEIFSHIARKGEELPHILRKWRKQILHSEKARKSPAHPKQLLKPIIMHMWCSNVCSMLTWYNQNVKFSWTYLVCRQGEGLPEVPGK